MFFSVQSYVTCALGIQFVGYVMMCFAATDSLCSLLCGRLARYTGRPVLYALGEGSPGMLLHCPQAPEPCPGPPSTPAHAPSLTGTVPTGAITNFSCIIALLLWRPNPTQLPLFFIFPGLWGLADAVWQTQNNGEKLRGPGTGPTWGWALRREGRGGRKRTLLSCQLCTLAHLLSWGTGRPRGARGLKGAKAGSGGFQEHRTLPGVSTAGQQH